MGAGAVQPLEGLVQNRKDPPLFLQRRDRNGKNFYEILWYSLVTYCAAHKTFAGIPNALLVEKVVDVIG